ncbi:MAG: FG-GAP repeat protein [Chrysiogenetes bacterium]|nr:FG-GAP repeat protein [Chrysiogenetes bacterium]
MKRLTNILLLALALLAPACSPGDEGAPGQTSLTLDTSARRYEWTATGDDGNAFWAFVSDLRYSDRDLAFDARPLGVFSTLPVLHQVLGEPSPRAAGEPEFFVAPRIDSMGYYHHFLQIRDEVSNASPLATIGAGAPSDLLTINPIQHELRDDLSADGAVSLDGDINGDGLADVVASDGTDKLYVYLGRDAYPYFAVDASDLDTDPDASLGTVGVCPSMEAQRKRLCAPDIVVDAAALGGKFGGRSSLAMGMDRTASSLAVADIDDDERDEIIVGAPEFMPFGTTEARGAVFVLDFDEDLVGTRQGMTPELDGNSYFYLYNAALVKSFLGRVTQADSRGVLVDDVLPFDNFPADMTKGVPYDSAAFELQSWEIFEEDPIRAYRRGAPIVCPAGDTVPCTGDNVTITSDLKVSTDGDLSLGEINSSEDRILLVLLDSTTGAPTAAALVRYARYTAPGVLGQIEVLLNTALPDLDTFAQRSGDAFALYRSKASGSHLPTPTRSGVEAGAPGNPIEIGNVLGKYDPATAGSVITLLDPTAPRVVPDTDAGERYPGVTFLGPEADSNFGDVVNAGGDLNVDKIPDIAIGAPTLSAATPLRYASGAANLTGRGGVFIVFGDKEIKQRDAAGAGSLSDGVYDFGPTGLDRPSSLVLGRSNGEMAGWSISGARLRDDDTEENVRNELGVSMVALAVGAPGACPRAVSDEMSPCNGEDRVGAVYLFVGNEYFESRDYRLPGGSADGVWDLAGDPTEELTGATELEPDALVAAQVGAPNERADAEIWGESDGDLLGWDVQIDAELNGDHVFDVVVSAPGHGDGGRIYIFHATSSEYVASGFGRLIASNAQRTGSITGVRNHNFLTRGNVDFDQRVDDDLSGFPDVDEDRCVMCVYDLSRNFPQWSVGPDVILSGGTNTKIGRHFDAGFFNNDAYEDLLLQVQGGSGDWITALNGVTNLLVQYRNGDLFAPLDSPLSTNYPDPGDSIGSPSEPVGVPGSRYAGDTEADAGEPLGVSWWVDRSVDGGLTRLGQVFVDVEAIYDETATVQASTIPEEQIAFGRAKTDDEGELPTRNTAELEMNFRAWPETIQRWNVLTHGGFFAESAGATDPFVGALDNFAVGGDHNGDRLSDVVMIVNGGELRVAH